MRTSSGTSCAREPDGSARSAVTKIKMPWSRKLRTSPHQVLQSMHILIRVVFPEEGQMTRRKVFGAAFVALLAVLGFTQAMLDRQALSQGETVQAPIFEVDPLWPKPLPNHWLLGASIGVWVDEQDVVWMIHRSSATLNNNENGAEISPPTGQCCRGAPQVLAFDQAGNLVRHSGGPATPQPRAATTGRPPAAGRRSSPPRGQRGRSSPTATRTSASRCSTPTAAR